MPRPSSIARLLRTAHVPHEEHGVTDDVLYVLILNPPPHRILSRRRANRIRYHAPRRPIIPRQLDAVGRSDVRRVPARHDSVGRHVLPLGAELTKLPVLPG